MSEEAHYVSPELHGVPGKLELGRWLGTTAHVIAENLQVLLVASSIILLPHLALTVGIQLLGVEEELLLRAADTPGDFSTGFFASTMGLALGVGAVLWLLTAISQGAVVYVVVQWLNGRKPDLSAALSVSVGRLGSILVTSLIVGLATGIATLACFVPGIILACGYFVAIPVTVTERLGAFESMRRSLSLTQSNRMTIFLAGLIYFALVLGLSMLVGVLSIVDQGPVMKWVQAGVSWGATVLQTVVVASAGAVSYVQLRGVRDGVSAEDLAGVFA